MQEFVGHCERRVDEGSVSKEEIFHKCWIHIVLHLHQLLHQSVRCALKEHIGFVSEEHICGIKSNYIKSFYTSKFIKFISLLLFVNSNNYNITRNILIEDKKNIIPIVYFNLYS